MGVRSWTCPASSSPVTWGPSRNTDQHVLGAAHVPVAIAQAIEQQVGEDVADGDDRERGEGGLHARIP